MTDGNPITGLKDTSFDMTRKASVVVRVLEEVLAERTPVNGHPWQAIAAAHGYPHTKQMRDHIDALKPLGDLPVTFDIPTPPPARKDTTMTEREVVGPIERLLFDADRHDRPAITRKAARIRTLLDELKTAIDTDREDAKRRAKIEALEAELAALKDTRKAETRTLNLELLACPDCGQECKGKRGLSAHTKIVHEGFRPNAAKAAS
jgi:hypothetical protein